jgi:hypothetical protein
MSEISILNGYKIKDKKAIRYYDTISNMKSDTTLKEGMYVKTKGYYSSDDNGNAEYLIVNDNTLVEDNGVIHNLSNGLKAVLKNNNAINVKQFGAYGDGTHDDTVFIQNAIDYIDNHAKTYGRSMNDSMLIIPGGRYKLTETLELKTSVRLRTYGLASFEYYGEDTAIWVMNDWTEAPDDRFTAREWMSGALIDGVGLIIKNMNATDSKNATDRGSTVGLEVGVRTATSSVALNCVCTYSIKNLRIENFKVGLKINPIYTYICDYDNMNIQRCNTCVQFGTTGQTVNNGTEKLSFTNCFICDSDVGFLWNVAPVHVDIYNSSLDYLNAMLVSASDFSNPTNIVIFGGHIEGVGDGTESNPSGYSGLIDGYFNRSNITFNGPQIATNRKPRLIYGSN